MYINPEKIRFESEEDIVNYLTKGIIPSKKNAEIALSQLDEDSEIRNAMQLVDENNRKNRMWRMAIGGALLVGTAMLGYNIGHAAGLHSADETINTLEETILLMDDGMATTAIDSPHID